jgi:hypothetical protein
MSTKNSTEEDAALVRLIEEGLFLGHADKCSVQNKNQTMSDDQKYLVEQVFPTLVPALHDLLKCHRRASSDIKDAQLPDSKQPDPVMWIAQYLIRNNVHHSTSQLAGHPFQLVNNAVLNKINDTM